MCNIEELVLKLALIEKRVDTLMSFFNLLEKCHNHVCDKLHQISDTIDLFDEFDIRLGELELYTESLGRQFEKLKCNEKKNKTTSNEVE